MAQVLSFPRLVLLAAGFSLGRSLLRARRGRADVAGANKSLASIALEAGSGTLQDFTPMKQFDVYLVGFHPMKDEPGHQMEAHHYCRQLNEDVMQCVLFDGNGPNARLNGVEYIVSERVYEELSEDEKQYWHPHNYEILSGQLVAPGLPDVAEKLFLSRKMNSYGKTWHLMWSTEGAQGLPLGEPKLAWSFNRDGEMDPCLLTERDQRMGVDTEQKRRQRSDLSTKAHPQRGVDALRDAFPQSSAPPPGVEDSSRHPT